MPDNWLLLYKGGGCDGQKTAGIAEHPPHDNIACGGTLYTVYRVEELSYLALLPTANPPGQYVPGPPPPQKVADAGALGAWNQLARAVNKDVPAAVLRTKDIRNRIRAAGRRG